MAYNWANSKKLIISTSKLVLTTGLLLIIVLLVTALAVPPGLAQGPPHQPPPPVPAPTFAPGEILVKFQSHVGLLGGQASLRGEGLHPLEASSRSGLLRVRVEPGQETKTIADLMARGDVEFATPNYLVQALGDPDDTWYGSQWALKQPDDHDIDAPEAWDIYTGSSNITIAILDTGVDLDHPDLQAKIVPGYDFVNNDNIPDDDHGHGTHVAGIAAAVSNNGQGIAGVSWGAKIMPLKMLDSGGGGDLFDLVDAIYYAVDNGAQVINMSLGGSNSKWPCYWPNIETAFNYAVSQDVLLVAAAGNDGQNGVNCPAAYDQVVAVGSTTSSDSRAAFSNYGARLDVVAPGHSIYSTLPGNYGLDSGTSMATPHVAGLAALVWSLAPSLSSSQVRDIIQNTADDLGPGGWDQSYGYGRINARRALDSISPQIPARFNLLIDDYRDHATGNIQIVTANPDVITWTAVISPPVSWLDLPPPASGTVSIASSPAEITLVATRPVTYNTYTATVAMAGTAVSGEAVGPIVTEVVLRYIPKIYEYHLPLLIKN